MTRSLPVEELERAARALRPKFESLLEKLVEIPSISMDPERRADVDACARAAADAIVAEGGSAEVCATNGFPVVVGALLTDPKNPTVTIYNHLDVQPAGGDWDRPPFDMAIEGDRYYARGATDDKGPALTALLAASTAVRAGVPINVRFLWELEEEIGSPNFEAFLRAKAKEIPTDSVVVSDTIWISRDKPALSAGLRGLQGAILRLETGTKECHSGLTGGAARNPLAELAEIVARCVDARTGKVRIPGFYDDVVPASRAELQSFVDSGFKVSEFKKAHGLKRLRVDSAGAVTKAIWAMPTFEVHGFAGGYQGPGVKTAVPPYGELKVSMRLVPDQSPKKTFRLLKAYVRKLNPDVVVTDESSLAPYRADTTGPLADAAREAIRFAYGKTPAFVREGGSIGAIVTMRKHLRCPVQFIGLSLPEHGYHAPNEFFDWGQAEGGMKTFAKYFELLSALPRRKR